MFLYCMQLNEVNMSNYFIIRDLQAECQGVSCWEKCAKYRPAIRASVDGHISTTSTITICFVSTKGTAADSTVSLHSLARPSEANVHIPYSKDD